MSCHDYREAIAEFVDGALAPARQRELERHVEGCPACRALVADLKTIQAAAFTLDRLELPPHLLAAVRARLAAEPRPSARGRLLAFPESRTARTAWLAAAAALLIITTAGIMSLTRSADPSGTQQAIAVPAEAPVDPVASVQAELQLATEHYEKAIQQLEQIARSDDGTLDPQVAAVFQKNLQVIDQAIDESRAALQMQPASAAVQEGLFDAMRSKVALLQQTVELINEMRKGNQAEAGRLIQGLNQ
ncbi:MAG TPA: zf-HC2 domain-containing protein [Vicinamibacterales bacterium]|nr:zf-HC2 domain-containing protein [Vicinamibacterales bacterium]